MTAARKLVDPYQEYVDEMVSNPRRKPKARVKRRRIPSTLKICLVAACCVVVSLFYLQQQVTSYYLSMELVTLQEQVNLMEQRNDHLMLNLESQRSLQQIEQIAREYLGMVEPEYIATLVVPGPANITHEVEGRWFAEGEPQTTSDNILENLAALVNKILPLGGVEAGTLQR